MMKRSRTLETAVVIANDERREIRDQFSNMRKALKAATEKADAVLEKLRQREAAMPRESPIPFRLGGDK